MTFLSMKFILVHCIFLVGVWVTREKKRKTTVTSVLRNIFLNIEKFYIIGIIEVPQNLTQKAHARDMNLMSHLEKVCIKKKQSP